MSKKDPRPKIQNALTRKSVLNDEIRKKKKNKGERKVKMIDTVEYQEKVERVYEYLRQGVSIREVYAIMLSENEKLNYNTFKGLIQASYVYAEAAIQKDREYVFQLHMERYEKMYERSMLMEDSWGRVLDNKVNPAHWPIICAHYANALKVLKAKEKLLGLHDKKIVLEFNDNKAVVVEPDEDRGLRGELPGYKLDNLSLQEQVELLELVRASRTVPLEGIQRVTIKQLKIEINSETGERTQRLITKNIDDIQDIEFEEMPENVVNKMQIKEREPEEEPLPAGPVVIDNTARDKGKDNPEEISDSIKNKLLNEFRQKLREKRGI